MRFDWGLLIVGLLRPLGHGWRRRNRVVLTDRLQPLIRNDDGDATARKDRQKKGIQSAKVCSKKDEEKRMKKGDDHLRLDGAVDNQLALID